MNRAGFVCTAVIAALALGAASSAAAAKHGGDYKLTILSDPLGGSYAQGSSISNHRLVGGIATLAGNTVMHAVLWPWHGTALWHFSRHRPRRASRRWMQMSTVEPSPMAAATAHSK